MRVSWDYLRIAEPELTPVSVAQALWNARGREDQTQEFAAYVAVATERLEQHLGQGIMRQTWRVVLDEWADAIPLPMAGLLASVSSVKYYDENGTLTTLSTSVYGTDATVQPGLVVRKPLQVWPALQSDRSGHRIEIEYLVGYDDPELVPARWVQAISLMVAALAYGCEGDPLTDAVRSLVAGDRLTPVRPVVCA